jgi:hypothetical protein
MDRIYHTWDKWECYPAGLYDKKPKCGDLSDDECKAWYSQLLTDQKAFEAALSKVVTEWKFSCEHYLTNENMNRLAWLGQAALCVAHGIPAKYRGGFNMLTVKQKRLANEIALKYLNVWLESNGHQTVDLDGAESKTQMDLY